MTLLNARESKPLEGGASFSLRHRVFRAAWGVAWALLAAWTPAPLHRWRVLLLNLAGAKVHPTAHVYGSAHIWYPPHLRMAPYSCLGPKVNCYNMAPIRLGDKAIVSQGAHLCAGTHDIDDPDHQLVTKPITIGDGAWIAAEAFIGPGVTIGAQAVVGARAVLTKDAEPYGVYIGNPAKWLRDRQFTQ
jgi:putative colanic acid biosynthesis acetyltransferase WcaF